MGPKYYWTYGLCGFKILSNRLQFCLRTFMLIWTTWKLHGYWLLLTQKQTGAHFTSCLLEVPNFHMVQSIQHWVVHGGFPQFPWKRYVRVKCKTNSVQSANYTEFVVLHIYIYLFYMFSDLPLWFGYFVFVFSNETFESVGCRFDIDVIRKSARKIFPWNTKTLFGFQRYTKLWIKNIQWISLGYPIHRSSDILIFLNRYSRLAICEYLQYHRKN